KLRYHVLYTFLIVRKPSVHVHFYFIGNDTLPGLAKYNLARDKRYQQACEQKHFLHSVGYFHGFMNSLQCTVVGKGPRLSMLKGMLINVKGTSGLTFGALLLRSYAITA